MNVILDATYDDWLTIQIVQDTAEITMQFFTHCAVAQERAAIFRGKHRVNEDLGK